MEVVSLLKYLKSLDKSLRIVTIEWSFLKEVRKFDLEILLELFARGFNLSHTTDEFVVKLLSSATSFLLLLLLRGAQRRHILSGWDLTCTLITAQVLLEELCYRLVLLLLVDDHLVVPLLLLLDELLLEGELLLLRLLELLLLQLLGFLHFLLLFKLFLLLLLLLELLFLLFALLGLLLLADLV